MSNVTFLDQRAEGWCGPSLKKKFEKHSGCGMNWTNMISGEKSRSFEPEITMSLGMAIESHVMDICYVKTTARFS